MTQNPLSISRGGKLFTRSKKKITFKDLALIYTPGVAKVVRAVAEDPKNAYRYTWKKRSVAIVSDGSAILGLGNLGALPALPVMEAKAVLFKELGGVDAVPVVLDTQDPEKIVEIIKAIAPSFGGINIEDISAPNCFVIKEKLKKELDIPVFHDDQYGTAIVVLAGLINAAKVARKDLKRLKIVISGAGAAGMATAKLLEKYGVKNIILFDSVGAIYRGRTEKMNFAKIRISQKTNPEKFTGSLKEGMVGADIFVGLSAPGIINRFDVEKMNKKSIVFALANPVPEIMPEEAQKGGVFIMATGRSDFPNQINNALVFPGIFKGALQTETVLITDELKLKAALALARVIKKPTSNNIIPKVMDRRAVRAVASVFGKNK